MKTLTKISPTFLFALLFIGSCTVSAFARVDPGATSCTAMTLERIENTLRYKLLVDNQYNQKVIIEIKNEFNHPVAQELSNNIQVERIYDFSTFEPGNYTIEVQKGKEKLSTTFTNYTLKDELQIFNVVFVSNRPERIYSVLMYNAAKDKVNLQLLNNKGELVFKQIIKEQETFGKNYNFSELKAGNYVLEVSRNDKKFTKFITLE